MPRIVSLGGDGLSVVLSSGKVISRTRAEIDAYVASRPSLTAEGLTTYLQSYIDAHWDNVEEVVAIHVYSLSPFRAAVTVVVGASLPDDWWTLS